MSRQHCFAYFFFCELVVSASKPRTNDGSNNRSRSSAESYRYIAKIEFCPEYLSADCFDTTLDIISLTVAVGRPGGGGDGGGGSGSALSSSVSLFMLLWVAAGGRRQAAGY